MSDQQQQAAQLQQQVTQAQITSLANQLGQKGAELANAHGQLTFVTLQLEAANQEKAALAARVQDLEAAAAAAGSEEEGKGKKPGAGQPA